MNCVQQSIQDKWIPIRDGKTSDADASCVCCVEFRSCRDGCPIWKHTRTVGCRDTPYYDVTELIESFIYYEAYDLHAECTAAAQMEIEFLEEVERGME